MEINCIKGPALVLDKEKCLSNIENMVMKARNNNIVFRPHFKTHQSHTIGRWFRDYGVDKITVSSLPMAYYFARDGWKDILVGIAYNPREYELYEKLAGNIKVTATIAGPDSALSLSEKCGFRLDVMLKIDTGYNRTGIRWDDSENLLKSIKVTATIAGPDSALSLSEKCGFRLDVMLKIDTGYNRTGIRWDDSKNLLDSIKHLSKNRNINLKGLMTHDGSTYGLNSRDIIYEQYIRSVERLLSCRDATGIDDLIVSAGDTPSASVVERFESIDEIRPGNFVFYDLMQYINGSCSFDDIALALLAPVIDIRPSSETVVVHAGAVHLSKESIIRSGKAVYGMLAPINSSGWHMPEEELYLSSLSQEHGIINCSGTKLSDRIKIGDLLSIIPVHSCLTADCMGGYMLSDCKGIDHMRGRSQEAAFLL